MKPLLYLMAYCTWVVCFRLISLTFLTYFLISPSSTFQDITDAFGPNEVSLMGLSSFLFLSLSYALFPFNREKLVGLVDRQHIEKEFLPGFLLGALFSGCMVGLFLLLGVYKYLGYFIQFGEAPLALTNVGLRILTLCALVYCEGYIFYDKIAAELKGLSVPPLMTLILVSMAYCGVKALQFNLGWMHLVTLFLLSISIQLRNSKAGFFAYTSGVWAAILVIINPILSLPIFGNDFSGVLLIKYVPPIESLAASAQSLSQSISQTLATGSQNLSQGFSMTRLLTGGMGGPLSSLVFQLVLILDIVLLIALQKRSTHESNSPTSSRSL